jgi:hypothetical protein
MLEGTQEKVEEVIEGLYIKYTGPPSEENRYEAFQGYPPNKECKGLCHNIR